MDSQAYPGVQGVTPFLPDPPRTARTTGRPRTGKLVLLACPTHTQTRPTRVAEATLGSGMIRNALVRTLEAVVVLLAVYAFFALPVGRRTPWGHLVAIFSTQPAQEAAEDVKQTVKDLSQKTGRNEDPGRRP